MGYDQPPRSGWAELARVANLGSQFVISCVAGAALGLWLDRRLSLTGRFPLLTLVGFFLGVAAGMLALLRSVRPPPAAGGKDDRPERGP